MRLVLLCILLLPAIGLAASSQVVVAEKRSSPYTIVIPDDAIPAERTAADELAEYLNQISGLKLPIQSESKVRSSTPAIHIGPTQRARQLAPELSAKLEPDTIVLKISDKDLILAGSRPRGSLYAVYTFLENLGVRWWTSNESDVPKSERIAISSDLDVTYTPKLRYREVYNHDVIHGNAPLAAHLKLNGHMTAIPEKLGGHYTLIGWCHTFYELIPPGEFFAKHPEWFSFAKGKRNPNHGQLCLTNDEMRAELTRRVLARIRKNPAAGIISVSQNDCLGACQCDKCQAIATEEGSESGPLIRFVNAVAADVASEFPDFLVETLAYQYTRKPPKLTKPARNVIVRLCSIECDFSHPLTAASNKAFADDLRGWAAIAPNLFIWNYVTNFSNYLIPHPNFEPLGEDLRFFSRSNVIGVFQQGDAYNLRAGDMLPLRTWVNAKLLWDPSQDQRQLRDEFLNGYFKSAGPFLGQYMDLVNSVAKAPGFTTEGCYGGEPSYISPEMLAQTSDLFARAQCAVAADPVVSARVRRERLVLDHLEILNYPFGSRLRELEKQGKPAAAMVEEYEKLVKSYADAAKAAGVRMLGEPQDFASYIPSLMAHANRHVPVELPQFGVKLPPGEFDIQEDQFYLHREPDLARRVGDVKASNRKAARTGGNHTEWAIQYHLPSDSAMIGKGPWKCYIVVRCDLSTARGTAFWYGLHDTQRGVFVSRSPVSADLVADGKYHTYAMHIDELRPGMYFWVSPAANPNIRNIYVDRIFLMKPK